MSSLAVESNISTRETKPLSNKINGMIIDWIEHERKPQVENGQYKYFTHFSNLQGPGVENSLFEINDSNPILTVIEDFYGKGIVDKEFLEEFDAFLEYMYSVDKEIINYEGYWKLKIIIEDCFPLDYESEEKDGGKDGEKDDYFMTEDDKKIFSPKEIPVIVGEFKGKFDDSNKEYTQELIAYANERMIVAKKIDDWYSLCNGDVAVIGVNETNGDATIEYLTELIPELGDTKIPSTPSGELKRSSSARTPQTLDRRPTLAMGIREMQKNDAQFVRLVKNTAEDELNRSVDAFCDKNDKQEECEEIKKNYKIAFDKRKDEIKVEGFIEDKKKLIELEKSLFDITLQEGFEEVSLIHRENTMKSVAKKFEIVQKESGSESGSESGLESIATSPPRLRRQSNLGFGSESEFEMEERVEETMEETELMDESDSDSDEYRLTAEDQQIFLSMEDPGDYFASIKDEIFQSMETDPAVIRAKRRSETSGGTRKNKKKKRRTKKYKIKKGTKKKRRRKKKTRDKR